MSALIPTLATPLDADTERLAHETFARTGADPAYRDLLTHLYPHWHKINERYFGNGLRVPHIGIGRTAPRRFSHCRLTTNYGGALDITIREGIAFGTDTRIVRQPWPSVGTTRFLEDLLLGEVVKQYVLEVIEETEEGYGGYGPRYAAEATRIGHELGLSEVPARRRRLFGAGLPVAAFWPWAFRPEDYYLRHVRFDHLAVGGRRARPSARRDVLPGVFEYLHFLMVTGNEARLLEILGREVDAATVRRNPAVAEDERSPRSEDGKRLPVPVVDPAWLWDCVRLIARAIRDRRAFDAMPILADALEDAGCDNPLILAHCRQPADHTANCWVLRTLQAAVEILEQQG